MSVKSIKRESLLPSAGESLHGNSAGSPSASTPGRLWLRPLEVPSSQPYNIWNNYVAVCQNLVPLVNINIAGKWMFIPLKMVLIGIDPYPCQ